MHTFSRYRKNMYLKCTGSSFTFAPKQSCWKSKANFNFTARQPPDTEQMNAAANTSIKSYIKTAVLSLPVRRKDTDIAEERSEGRRSVEKVVESTQCTTHPPDSRKALGKEALWLHSNITLNSVWGQSNSLAHGSQLGHQLDPMFLETNVYFRCRLGRSERSEALMRERDKWKYSSEQLHVRWRIGPSQFGSMLLRKASCGLKKMSISCHIDFD